jgi:hypothetical protein
MLEAAILRNLGDDPTKPDVGRIYEAMLYYGKVNLFLEYGPFISLWKHLGKEGISTLLKHDSINAIITPQSGGVYNTTTQAGTTHKPTYFHISGANNVDLKYNVTDVSRIMKLGFEGGGDFGISLKDIDWVIAKAEKTSFEKILLEEAKDHHVFRSLISDNLFVKTLIRTYAKRNSLNIDDGALFHFVSQVFDEPDGFISMYSNVRLESLFSGSGKHPSWGDILGLANQYSINLFLSQSYSADFIPTRQEAEFATQRIDQSISRALRNGAKIEAFESVVFENVRRFSSAINAGEISHKDALKLIDKTRKFRTWATNISPSGDLLESYVREINAENIMEKLPVKASRFAFFTAAPIIAGLALGDGLTGIGAAVGFNGFDYFVMDKLFKGWKPNAFVTTVKSALNA